MQLIIDSKLPEIIDEKYFITKNNICVHKIVFLINCANTSVLRILFLSYWTWNKSFF